MTITDRKIPFTQLVLLLALFAWADSPRALDPGLMGEVEYAMAMGHHDEARRRIEHALDTVHHRDLQVRSELWQALAQVHQKTENWTAAGDAWLRAAELAAEQLGGGHPDLAPLYERASLAYERAGDLSAALDSGDRALVIDQALLGRFDPAVTDALQRLSRLARKKQDPDLAARYRPPPRLRGAQPRAAAARPVAEPIDTLSADFGDVDENSFSRVRVYFGTDRAPTGDRRPNTYFGGELDELRFGSVEVSVPRTHKPGAIEQPSMMTLEFRENPERHMVLLSLSVLEGDEALRQMREHLAENNANEAFVFVHGYNVSFAAAARRTAQMTYDLNFDGLPIMYSWPSRGSTLNYIADTAVVRHSGRRLSRFLDRIVQDSGATRIHLVGHSMGSRALADALELYALRNGTGEPAFDQIIFTAPDIDSGLFAEMSRTFAPVGRRVTLYTSEVDAALSTSRRLHGSRPRAGQGGDSILVQDHLDTVDMTALGEDMLRHSYFANDASALTDLLTLFTLGNAPELRCGLVDRMLQAGRYWSFDPERCDGGATLSALALLREHGISGAASHAVSMLEVARQRDVGRAIVEWQAITEEIQRLITE